jgi:hypothetical protein
MRETTNTIAWLEGKITQAHGFLERDRARLHEMPDDFAAQLSARSWETHVADLQQDLRQRKEALRRELVEIRLFGTQVDNGSIPLRLLGKIAQHVNALVGAAAYHIRYGVNPARGIDEGMANELDLRLSGLAFGSSRLLVSGNISPDTTGESLLDTSLQQVFNLINAETLEQMHELVPVIGTRAVKETDALLSALEGHYVGASMTWSAPNDREYQWGGTLQAVRTTRERLAQVSQRDPESVVLRGTVRALTDTGRIAIKVADEPRLVRVRYPSDLYTAVQQMTLGAFVELSAMKHSFVDELTGEQQSRYVLTDVSTVTATLPGFDVP